MTSSPRQFLRRMATAFIGVLLVNITFNLGVDTYDVFGTPTITGWNDIKRGIDRHSRIAKAYAVRKFAPEAIILGSSRAESTFDPAHPYFQRWNTYNLAFPGVAIYEEYRYLQHATASGKLKKLLIVPDFQQFLSATQQASSDFSEDRLAIDRNGSTAPPPLKDMLWLAASGSAFQESWWSFQRPTQPSIYRADGYRIDTNDIPAMLARPGGQKAEFLGVERSYLRLFQGRISALTNTAEIQRSPWNDFEEILKWSRTHGIEVEVAIAPMHARMLSLIELSGKGPWLADWKRRLTMLVAQYHTRPSCPLWDFASANQITGEAVPAASSKVAMKYWRESSHATRASGLLMLDVMERGSGEAAGGQTYGHCLRPQDIDRTLPAQKAALADWQHHHPEDLIEIQSVIARQP